VLTTSSLARTWQPGPAGATAGPPGVTAEVLSETPDISAVRRVWGDLFERPGNEPSTSFEWTQAMLRSHLEPGDRFFLVRIARGTESLGLVPLTARTTTVLGQRVVSISPISDRYNTHGDILASVIDEALVEAFVSALFELRIRWDVFRMSKVLETNPLLGFIERCLRRRRATYRVRFGRAAYFLLLPDSFEAFLGQRSAKFRSFLRRTQKKIERSGQTEVVQCSAVDDFDRAYTDVLQIEKHSWKHKHGTAISAVARQTTFYRDMCRSEMALGRMHLQFLRWDGEPIAYNMGYTRDGCYYYLKTSYDERFKTLSPATYLRAALIQWAIGQGLRVFDFPGEPYEWERQWTETVRWHKTLLIYNDTLRARVLSCIDRLRRGSGTKPLLVHSDPLALEPPAPQRCAQ
jgi:CelD/BcsL family acetyltransferase involved in cellulose biosynthesis